MKKITVIVAIFLSLFVSNLQTVLALGEKEEIPPSVTRGEWDAAKAETMRELLSFVKEGKDFVVEQTPLVAQEILRWGIINNTYKLCLAILTVVVSGLILYWCSRYFRTTDDLDDHPEKSIFFGLVGIFSFTAGALAVAEFFFRIYAICFICFAPRLYLIERISELLK